jgi:hypothetical protein
MSYRTPALGRPPPQDPVILDLQSIFPQGSTDLLSGFKGLRMAGFTDDQMRPFYTEWVRGRPGLNTRASIAEQQRTGLIEPRQAVQAPVRNQGPPQQQPEYQLQPQQVPEQWRQQQQPEYQLQPQQVPEQWRQQQQLEYQLQPQQVLEQWRQQASGSMSANGSKMVGPDSAHDYSGPLGRPPVHFSGYSTPFTPYGKSSPAAPTVARQVDRNQPHSQQTQTRIRISNSMPNTVHQPQFQQTHGGIPHSMPNAVRQVLAPQLQPPVVAQASQSHHPETKGPAYVQETINRAPDNAPTLRTHPTLDPGFIVRPKKYYAFGKVFITLWTETAASSTRKTLQNTYPVAFGEIAISKPRRFVVIGTGEKESCICAPIHTYSGRGTDKPGVNVLEHCIIYMRRKGAETVASREPLRPVGVDPDHQNASLDPSSRLHLGKHYTVEYNMKTKNLGKVNPHYLQALLDNVLKVFRSFLPSPDREGDDDDDSPPGNNPPGRSGSSHAQARIANSPRVVLRRLGFKEAEMDDILNRISQNQNQREAIAVVARARAQREGLSTEVANRVANIVVSPIYVPYPNALLQARRDIMQQAQAGSATENANDDDDDDDDDED